MIIMLAAILTVFVVVQTQKAFLLSSSVGFYNYRQTANVFKIYHNLKLMGFSDADILLSVPENSGCCEKNQLYGEVSFKDGEYDNINQRVSIDHKQSTMGLKTVFNALRGKYSTYTLNRNRITPEGKEPLFVYITGHGGDYYFKLREREALIEEHFIRLFRDINLRKTYESVVLLSDSCSAVTPFQNIEERNLCVLGSSSLNQKSSSHGFDIRLNIAKSDDFTYYLDQWMQRLKEDWAIRKLHSYLDRNKLNVDSKLVQGRDMRNVNLLKYMRRLEKVRTV